MFELVGYSLILELKEKNYILDRGLNLVLQLYMLVLCNYALTIELSRTSTDP